MKKYVLTGGPGIGKTTIIEILSSMDYEIVPEAARIIIEEEQIKNSDALPWKDLKKFQNLVVQKQLEDEDQIKSEIAFLDRGIVDGYGYCMLGNVDVPELIIQNAQNRYEKVFILDQLETYANDSARLETQDEAKKVHEAIIGAYQHFGYEVVFVPVLPPEERVKFILNRL